MNQIEMKKKLKQNNKIVYEMYNKYKYLLEELDVYKDQLIEQIEDQTNEAEGEGEGEGNANTKDLESIIKKDENYREMSTELKDYKLYLLAKELRLTRWNSSLEGSINVLKENNINNNTHILEQKQELEALIQRLEASEQSSKSIRDSIKDFRNEMKSKLKNLPKDNIANEILSEGELDPHNAIVMKLTHYIKAKVMSDVDEIERNRPLPFDPKPYDDKFVALDLQLKKININLSDKTDRSYTDVVEESLKKQFEKLVSKTSIKIKSLSDLADNETLQTVFTELIDERYTEYEKSLAKVYGKMDRVDTDIERCFEEYSRLIEFRKDIARNEQKLDRIYTLIGTNEDDNDDPSDYASDEQSEKGDNEESKDEHIHHPADSVQNEEMNSSNFGARLGNHRQSVDDKRSSQRISSAAHERRSSVGHAPKRKQSKKKMNALKIMFVNLEGKVEDIEKRLADIELSDKLVAEASESIAHNSGSIVNSKGNLLIQTEFTGMKHLVGRHQVGLKRIESVITQLNEWKNEFNMAKLYEDNKSDLEILKKYIEEVNEYHAKLYKNTESKLHSKADFNIMEEFTHNVEDKVMKDLQTKIDRMEHKRVQNSIRRKIDAIEKEVLEMNKSSIGNTAPFKSPSFVTNDKCISCNRDIQVKKNSIPEDDRVRQKKAKNKYMFKELYLNAQKMGGGFSRILETIEKPDDINMLTINESYSKVDESTITNNTPDISQNHIHSSTFSNKTNSKLSMLNRSKTNTSLLNQQQQNTNTQMATVLPSIQSSLNFNNIDLPSLNKKGGFRYTYIV